MAHHHLGSTCVFHMTRVLQTRFLGGNTRRHGMEKCAEKKRAVFYANKLRKCAARKVMCEERHNVDPLYW